MVNVPGLTPWTYQQSEQDSGRMPVGIMYLPEDDLRGIDRSDRFYSDPGAPTSASAYPNGQLTYRRCSSCSRVCAHASENRGSLISQSISTKGTPGFKFSLIAENNASSASGQ